MKTKTETFSGNLNKSSSNKHYFTISVLRDRIIQPDAWVFLVAILFLNFVIGVSLQFGGHKMHIWFYLHLKFKIDVC